MQASIHQINWNGVTYYKVYAENLNGRMILAAKTKFKTESQAREFATIMLPSHKVDKKVREVKF